MKSGLKFQDWRSQRFSLFGSLIETLEKKLDKEKAKVSQLMTENGSFQLVRERSTGDNIFDAKRKVFSKNADGTIKKSVITETYARVTLRQKRKAVDDVSGSAQIKRAKKINNILDHTTQKDKDAKASLMTRILFYQIDKEGAEFGATIERKSKVMHEINQLNPEQTSSPMTSTRTPEYVWRQSRTAFKDNLGFSPISSQRKVDMFRKKVMA